MPAPAAQAPRPWTSAEDAQLAELWATEVPAAEIARQLGRSAQAIWLRRHALALPLRVSTTSLSDDQLATLRAMYDAWRPLSEIGARLERSLHTIRGYARRLGLRRPRRGPTRRRRWSAADDARLTSLYGQGLAVERIAELLERPVLSTKQRASRLGLVRPRRRRRHLRWRGPPPPGDVVVSPDGTCVQCHVCGAWRRALAPTHIAAHGMTADDYRSAYGLSADRPLVAPATAARLRDMAIRTDRGALLRPGAWGQPPRAGRALSERRTHSAAMRRRSPEQLAAEHALRTAREQHEIATLARHLRVGRADLSAWLRGRRMVQRRAMQILAELPALPPPQRPPRRPNAWWRTPEVVRLLESDLSSAAVGETLGLVPGTVRSMRQRLNGRR